MTLGNGTAEDVLGVGTYRLKLREGNSLVLHDTLYALGYDVPWCLMCL